MIWDYPVEYTCTKCGKSFNNRYDKEQHRCIYDYRGHPETSPGFEYSNPADNK
jgi:hypothetical protein